ncbi:patatin-like phospholipase family protein [Rhodobacteraceae bacterium CCMM004]|nr:patatin-like phospholipase family protein [Rhodobacteraceae bacterium CCMM004]
MDRPVLPFAQIVFSGGGIRCFWHGGWMTTVSERWSFDPARVTGVSGGALSASAWLAGAEERLLDVMSRAFRGEDANVSWHDINDEDGLTPHQRVYREVVEEVLAPPAQKRIADGPAFQILVGRPADGALTQLHALLSGAAYSAEKVLIARPDSEWAETLGLTGELIDARAAAREGRLVELVCAAATIPPVFRIPDWDGRPVIDGGMVDQAPSPEPDEGRTLVLLTRDYREIPDDGRSYVIPSRHVLDGKIDFTDPDKLKAAWELGAADGRAWAPDDD